MDLHEIDAEIQRLQKLKTKAEAVAAEKKKEENLEEARVILSRLVEDLNRLEAVGYLPPRLQQALSNDSGKFSPGLYIKRPRGSADQPNS